MKYIYSLLVMSVVLLAMDVTENPKLQAKESFNLERSTLHLENDFIFGTDHMYTSGFKLSNLYSTENIENDYLKIPLLYDSKNKHFVSLGIAQQIYTPYDTESSNIVNDDRAYAGWLYLEYGLHESSNDELDSLVLHVGIIGDNSISDHTQKVLHSLRGIRSPNGWENQLNDELGLNISYQHKWCFTTEKLYGFENNFIPFIEGNLGNIDTSVEAGMLINFGINSVKDFGYSPMNIGGGSAIPRKTDYRSSGYNSSGFTLNFAFSAKAVERIIFLDGNTFSSSHSVPKSPLIIQAATGFTISYKKIIFNCMLATSSKEFTTQRRNHKYGSFIFSYLY